MYQEVIQGLLIPFLGTALGACCVFFMKQEMSKFLRRVLAGFAAGVMVAASIWSLIIPAIEQSAHLGKLSFIPAVVGFWCGILFLLFLDYAIPHLHVDANEAEGPKSHLSRTTMMVLAVTLHNIPEGMAIGVVYAGYLAGSTDISLMGALALSIGIAIQNFPEGAIVSMPLKAEGTGRSKGSFAGNFVRSCGTNRCTVYHYGRQLCCAFTALFTKLCSRSHDVCCGGRINSRDGRRRTFQCRNAFL